MNRREFIKVAARGLGTAVLGYVVGAAAWRQSKRPRDGACRGNGVCRGCPVVAACAHPTALSFRKNH